MCATFRPLPFLCIKEMAESKIIELKIGITFPGRIFSNIVFL
jgi:hypothetical protein